MSNMLQNFTIQCSSQTVVQCFVGAGVRKEL